MAIKPISVSQFNNYVKRVLQTDPLLGNVSVIGEISNLKYHGSGHVFFTLKDEQSKLSCFLPADQVPRLRYELTEGMLITATGYISVFERGGTYSLNIRDILVEGKGNLTIAFEALKAKLEKEGLFDPKYKKPIPTFPKKVVVITSETGAAIRDILKIIRQRNDVVHVILYPCLVQGPDAAADIAAAITEVNRLFPDTDVIIVGRGGGSIEELWAFNEEVVVRSIFLSEIPVISAVGHETDFTLADYVADRRAATPTEAAQMAVPDTKELRIAVKNNVTEILHTIQRRLQYYELKTESYNMEALKNQISNRIQLAQMHVNGLAKDMFHMISDKLTEKMSTVEQLYAELQLSSPYSIMERGYGALVDVNGKLITSVEGLNKGDLLTVICKDGKIKCSIEEVRRADYGR
ncbi:MAG TPA: exodeoxyribonuclease VII large subunit [Clostridiales bacterium UBA9856]|jgi:exodeoxyribonuclease VII large subunit|nr:exodeoxyribonuclease VII large subunit [Clostridiales bacterium UBA9856]HOA42350.1 exodeoxyribonuclease VII large subunit [Bacillota bacterium]